MISRGEKLVLASHNQGKLKEFAQAFAPYSVGFTSAAALGLPEPEETGATFTDNALLKARAAALGASMAALADDSGLAVTGLDGAPGIYSARWAGPGKDFAVAFDRIKTELEGKGISPEGAEAAFVCVLAVVTPQGQEITAEGRVTGRLTFPPRGSGGFGYDPVFVPEGEGRTFGEMTPEEKARFSHRMRAFDALVRKIWPDGAP